MRALGTRHASDLQQQRPYGPRQRPARAPRLAVMARQLGDKPVLMVNSCTGKMGRAVAEAATRAGLRVLPFTLCGAGEASRAAGGRIEVAGQQVELVEPSRRDAVIESVKQQHPDLVMVDYTVPGGSGPPGRSHGGSLVPVGAECERGRERGRERVFACMRPWRGREGELADAAPADGGRPRRPWPATPQPPAVHADAIMEMAALYQKHKTPFVMGTTGGDREKLLRDTEVGRARSFPRPVFKTFLNSEAAAPRALSAPARMSAVLSCGTGVAPAA
jgi:hypothetical protein